jgi:hypothetical protein
VTKHRRFQIGDVVCLNSELQIRNGEPVTAAPMTITGIEELPAEDGSVIYRCSWPYGGNAKYPASSLSACQPRDRIGSQKTSPAIANVPQP